PGSTNMMGYPGGGGGGFPGGGGYPQGGGIGGAFTPPANSQFGGQFGGQPGTQFGGQPGGQPGGQLGGQLGSTTATIGGAPGTGQDLTGSYLGYGGGMGGNYLPRIVPNPFDNTLLIQATPQQWEQIARLLEQLDIPPRQVLIDARIYEVDLTGAFASGVEAYLAQKNAQVTSSARTGGIPLTRQLLGSFDSLTTNLTAGMLVGQSRQLLALLTAQESNTKARVISAPSVIATDSIQASINVGTDVPTLSSQAVAGGLQQGGNSLFTNTIQNRSTGVSLNILARVNSSGVVTMVIAQDVSAPVPNTTSTIDSPSFSKRNVTTQVTVQDGDTIAIGGIIQETATEGTSGIPGLHRIPILGAAFGTRNFTKQRTELIIFLTPRVIYDTNQVAEATDELKSRVKRLTKMIKEN
ncbi:MAG: hypothetical protein M3Z23_07940, partial [Acidobacteriota bacterium]|nr:hypothetical protein [Acidobacteriota bacterium]